jgi:hypothetical protein
VRVCNTLPFDTEISEQRGIIKCLVVPDCKCVNLKPQSRRKEVIHGCLLLDESVAYQGFKMSPESASYLDASLRRLIMLTVRSIYNRSPFYFNEHLFPRAGKASRPCPSQRGGYNPKSLTEVLTPGDYYANFRFIFRSGGLLDLWMIVIAPFPVRLRVE